jgi:hypothetical protein
MRCSSFDGPHQCVAGDHTLAEQHAIVARSSHHGIQYDAVS